MTSGLRLWYLRCEGRCELCLLLLLLAFLRRRMIHRLRATQTLYWTETLFEISDVRFGADIQIHYMMILCHTSALDYLKYHHTPWALLS